MEIFLNRRIKGESHIDFRTQCVIMTQIQWHPPHPLLNSSFQIFDKIDSFLKHISNVLDSKKGRIYLWRTFLFTYNCWLTFFLFRCGFQEEIEPSWRNYLIWTTDRGGEHNILDTQNTPIIILISNCSNASGFLNWR